MKKYSTDNESIKLIANKIIGEINCGETNGKFSDDCTRTLANTNGYGIGDDIAELIKEETGKEVYVSLYTYQIPGGRMRRFAVDISWRWYVNEDSKEMDLGVKKLLMAVVKGIAEGVREEMIESMDTEYYLDAAWKAEDLVRYNRVLSSLDEHIRADETYSAKIKADWLAEFLESGGDWYHVKDWIKEYDNWNEVIHNQAVENELTEFEDKVVALFE